MKILFEVSTYNYKSYHSLAKRIKEIMPKAQFGIADGPEVALSFLRQQNDIKYEKVEMSKIDGTLFKEDIDYNELKKFEEGLPHKSLWRMVAGDRGLGRAFLHGAIGYRTVHDNDYKFILQSIDCKLRQIRKVFDGIRNDS